MHGLEGRNHKVYFDNLFTTIGLLTSLRHSKISATGTPRKNRLLGAGESLQADKEMRERGSYSYATSDNDVTIVKWNDNSLVHTASTFAGVHPVGSVRRWDKRQQAWVDVTRPFAIEVYNEHMGGVDLTDFLVACYRHTLKHKRWYLRLFFHFMNLAITNSWIIYRWLDLRPNRDLLSFRSNIAMALMMEGERMVMQRKRGRPRGMVELLPSASEWVRQEALIDLCHITRRRWLPLPFGGLYSVNALHVQGLRTVHLPTVHGRLP